MDGGARDVAILITPNSQGPDGVVRVVNTLCRRNHIAGRKVWRCEGTQEEAIEVRSRREAGAEEEGAEGAGTGGKGAKGRYSEGGRTEDEETGRTTWHPRMVRQDGKGRSQQQKGMNMIVPDRQAIRQRRDERTEERTRRSKGSGKGAGGKSKGSGRGKGGIQ